MKNLFSLNLVNLALIALIVVPLFSSCKDPEDPVILKTGTELTAFNISAGGQTFSAQLNADGKTLEFLVPYLVNGVVFDQSVLATATITFTLSEGATSDPPSGSSQDLRTDLPILVTAEDVTVTKEYIVTKKDGTSSEKAIMSFVLDIGEDEPLECEIDAVNFVVYYPRQPESVYLALSNATPTFTLSLGATADPETGVARNFSPFEVDEDGELVLDDGDPIPVDPVVYVVTAHDGSTQVWTVQESRRTGKDITGFALDFFEDELPPHDPEGGPRGEIRVSSLSEHADRDAKVTIDVENGIITYELPLMPEWFDKSKMVVYPSYINFSDGWLNCEPHFTDALDFSQDQTYVVTAEDGSTKEWTIKAPTLLFQTQWSKEYATYAGSIEDGGIQNPNSIGLIGDYLALGRTAALINKDDGTVADKKLNVTDIWRSNSTTGPTAEFRSQDYPFFITNDDAGNLLSASLSAWKNDVFTVHKWSDPSEDPEILMEFPTIAEGETAPFSSFGRKFQALGDVNGKGLLIAPDVQNTSSVKQYIWTIDGGEVDIENPEVLSTNLPASYSYQLLTPLGLEPEAPYYIGTHSSSINNVNTYPTFLFGDPDNTENVLEKAATPFDAILGTASAHGWGNLVWGYQKLFTWDGKDMVATLSGSYGYYCFAILERKADDTHVVVTSGTIPWTSAAYPNTNGTAGFTMEKVGNDVVFYVLLTGRGIFSFQLGKF